MKLSVLIMLCATAAFGGSATAAQEACNEASAVQAGSDLAKRMEYNVAICHQEILVKDTARCDCTYTSHRYVDGWFSNYYEVVSHCSERRRNSEVEFFTNIKVYVNSISCQTMSTPVWQSAGSSLERSQKKLWDPIQLILQNQPSEPDPALCVNPGYCNPQGG